MSGHFRKECIHGWVESTCRCRGPHPVQTVPCPGPSDRGFARHAQFVERQIADNKLAPGPSYSDEELAKLLADLDIVTKEDAVKETLEAVYEHLRMELRKANEDHAHKLKILENPYCSHERFQERREAFGVARGLARSMEIVEAMLSE